MLLAIGLRVGHTCKESNGRQSLREVRIVIDNRLLYHVSLIKPAHMSARLAVFTFSWSYWRGPTRRGSDRLQEILCDFDNSGVMQELCVTSASLVQFSAICKCPSRSTRYSYAHNMGGQEESANRRALWKNPAPKRDEITQMRASRLAKEITDNSVHLLGSLDASRIPKSRCGQLCQETLRYRMQGY